MLHTETETMYAAITIIVYVVMGIAIVGGIVISIFSKWWAPAAIGFGIAALAFGSFVWGEWPPYSAQYHTYVPVTITVQSIGDRFIGGSNNQGSTERFAVLATDGQTYGVDDTRASVLVKGDVVTLLCEQQWETNGVPGYVCNWGKSGPND